jgi:hypothetical protein
MTSTSPLTCPNENRKAWVLLVLLALVSSLVLVANPGYFSHDEWEKYDYVVQHGWLQYFIDVVGLPQVADFGHPVRPVSFFVQGLVAPLLNSFPVAVHLVDVLMHALVAILLLEVTARISRNRQLAWVASLLFLISPLAAYSVGWPAALMDRLYVLFGLVALLAAHSFVTRASGAGALIVVFLASALAMLSKETAVVLPASLTAFVIFSVAPWRERRLWTALVVWCVPVALFMAYRLPALLNSLSGTVASPYATSLANIPEGVFVYALTPFLPTLLEANAWKGQPGYMLWIAGLMHLSLVSVLWRAFSIRVALVYLAGYFLFLLPVLPLAMRASQYLYASATVVAIALAALFTLRWQWFGIAIRLVVISALAALTLHTLVLQAFMYKTGECMSSAKASIESVYLSDGRPSDIAITIAPGAPAYVLLRFTHDRQVIGAHFPVKMQPFAPEDPASQNAPYVFDSSCIVSKKR